MVEVYRTGEAVNYLATGGSTGKTRSKAPQNGREFFIPREGNWPVL
jgi:hypothetical protein